MPQSKCNLECRMFFYRWEILQRARGPPQYKNHHTWKDRIYIETALWYLFIGSWPIVKVRESYLGKAFASKTTDNSVDLPYPFHTMKSYIICNGFLERGSIPIDYTHNNKSLYLSISASCSIWHMARKDGNGCNESVAFYQTPHYATFGPFY